MKKRNFLLPFAAIAAALGNGEVVAKHATNDLATTNSVDVTSAKNQVTDQVVVSANGNQFDFILKRNTGGELMAYHSSHRSHMSHSSHRSHFSSYN